MGRGLWVRPMLAIDGINVACPDVPLSHVEIHLLNTGMNSPYTIDKTINRSLVIMFPALLIIIFGSSST